MTDSGETTVEVPTDDTDETEEAVDTTYLDDLEDGCGCAEVWEHLSREREE